MLERMSLREGMGARLAGAGEGVIEGMHLSA